MKNTKAARLAARYVPEGFEKIEHPAGLGVAYLGKLTHRGVYWEAREYRGSAAKAQVSYHKTEAEARAEIERWFKALTGHAEFKAKMAARVEREAAPFKNGDYLSCAQTAVLVRKALAAKFPGVKFSVVSDTYSMGASIRVHWTDGPTVKEVEAVAKMYGGAEFDGMIDLKTHNNHWLMPDGSVTIAHNPGTVGSHGFQEPVDTPRPHPEAVCVSLGADYVFCSRKHSELELLKAAVAVSEKFGLPPVEVKDGELAGPNLYKTFGSFDQRSLIHQYLEKTEVY